MSIRNSVLLLTLLVAGALAGCGGGDSDDAGNAIPPGPPAPTFSQPERVTITGYEDDAMEPFISPDGRYLFFNNSNASNVDTDLRYAERVDDRTFQYRGPVVGANSTNLDGVPSMDLFGNFYFVSLRSYNDTLASVFRGTFANGAVSGVQAVAGIAPTERGRLDLDAAISADGNTLYFTEGLVAFLTIPLSGKIVVANRTSTGFAVASNSEDIMRAVNVGEVSYAAAISQSGLEIFFNRLERGTPVVYTSTRANTTLPFGAPQKIVAIDGFAEGPALSPDEKSLYYHRSDAGRFVIYRVTRP